MLSRRDKLLILPWQQRKYENHLRKVKSAVPVIDNRPPLTRQHVSIKLKRKQSEIERRNQVERDNLILLQKLNALARRNRVDNRWSTPQPNFLNRVRMRDYRPDSSVPKIPSTTIMHTIGTTCSVCKRGGPPIPKDRSKSVPIPKLPSICEEKVRGGSSGVIKPKCRPEERGSSQRLMLNRGSLVLEVNFPPDSYVKFKDGHTEKLIMGGLCHCKNLTKKI